MIIIILSISDERFMHQNISNTSSSQMIPIDKKEVKEIKIPSLLNICERELSKRVNTKTVISALIFADKYSARLLSDYCHSFIKMLEFLYLFILYLNYDKHIKYFINNISLLIYLYHRNLDGILAIVKPSEIDRFLEMIGCDNICMKAHEYIHKVTNTISLVDSSTYHLLQSSINNNVYNLNHPINNIKTSLKSNKNTIKDSSNHSDAVK